MSGPQYARQLRAIPLRSFSDIHPFVSGPKLRGPPDAANPEAGTFPRDGTAGVRTEFALIVMWLPATSAADASASGRCGATDGAWFGSCAAPDAARCGPCGAADVAPCRSVRPPAGRSAGWAVGPQPLISAGWRQALPWPTRPVQEKKAPFDARSSARQSRSH